MCVYVCTCVYMCAYVFCFVRYSLLRVDRDLPADPPDLIVPLHRPQQPPDRLLSRHRADIDEAAVRRLNLRVHLHVM